MSNRRGKEDQEYQYCTDCNSVAKKLLTNPEEFKERQDKLKGEMNKLKRMCWWV